LAGCYFCYRAGAMPSKNRKSAMLTPLL